MFLKTELERFKSSNAWAARKAEIMRIKDLPPPPPSQLSAKVRLELPLISPFSAPIETIDDFTWNELPHIRARIHQVHGDVAFVVEVSGPDGASWSIDYQPPTVFEKLWKRIKGK